MVNSRHINVNGRRCSSTKKEYFDNGFPREIRTASEHDTQYVAADGSSAVGNATVYPSATCIGTSAEDGFGSRVE